MEDKNVNMTALSMKTEIPLRHILLYRTGIKRECVTIT